jgi:hypothetical protein
MVAGIATERNCCIAGSARNELDYNNRAGFPQRLRWLSLRGKTKRMNYERHGSWSSSPISKPQITAQLKNQYP